MEKIDAFYDIVLETYVVIHVSLRRDDWTKLVAQLGLLEWCTVVLSLPIHESTYVSAFCKSGLFSI